MPGYQLAVCCFNNADPEKEPHPLFWWYKPVNPDILVAPGVDAHNGEPPNLETNVNVDTTLIIGSSPHWDVMSVPMPETMPAAFRPFAPARIRRWDFRGSLRNADYVTKAEELGAAFHEKFFLPGNMELPQEAV